MMNIQTFTLPATMLSLSMSLVFANQSLCETRQPPPPPYVGVSYYPEVAGDKIDQDIRQMKEIGVNMVRMSEFAWIRMEPSKGSYDFTWLHQVVDKMTAAGIAVVLCTPTATPPIWLSERHPEILRVNPTGQRITHGGRRHYCPNSPVYQKYSVQIAQKMADEFATSPFVVAWQIDNEFWDDCYCPECEKAFHAWLKKRYGTIENMNQTWATVLWSQEYQSFDQVPLPNPSCVGGRHHPSLRVAYRHFMSDSYVAYCDAQARVIRKRTGRAVTTNAHNPVYQRIDYEALFSGLDIVGTDSYAGPTELLRFAFEADWMRALGKRFWLAETCSTHAAAAAVGDKESLVFYPGSLRSKMWLTYALGGETVSFWLWKTHWAGQEMEHGSLVYPWGEECANTPEIRQVAKELSAHANWLRNTRPKPAAVALHYGVPLQWQFEASAIAASINYDADITGFHRLLANAGIPRDVIMAGAPVDSYQVVFSPFVPSLDADLMQRMKAFVEKGGTWVLGPLSACRTTETTAHQDACYGAAFEKWLGVHVRHRMTPGGVTKLKDAQETVACRLWCDAYELRQSNRRVIASYAGGPLNGFAAVVECPIGKGRVILLGTQPDDAWLTKLVKRLAPQSTWEATPGVVITERVTADNKPAGAIVVNTQAEPATYRNKGSEAKTLAGYGVEFVTAK
jgi:beta-galactosidase GanA